MLDFDLFSSQMALLRHWKPERCKHEWNLIRQSGVERDELGLPPHTERLAVPGRYLGTDARVARDIDYVDGSVQQSAKAKAMTEEEVAAGLERAKRTGTGRRFRRTIC